MALVPNFETGTGSFSPACDLPAPAPWQEQLAFETGNADLTSPCPPYVLPPVVSAGPNRAAYPNVVVSLVGTATSAAGDALAYQWSQASGPGACIITQATTLTPVVEFPQVGTYVLVFTATDTITGLSASAVVTVFVYAVPTAGSNGSQPTGVTTYTDGYGVSIYTSTYQQGGSVFRYYVRDGVAQVLNKFPLFTGDGKNAVGAPVLGPAGKLYGLTLDGGTPVGGDEFGTIYSITPSDSSATGGYASVHSFNGTTEGGNPRSSMVLANDGNLYGITARSDVSPPMILFRFDGSGNVTVIYTDNSGAFGNNTPTQAGDGNFYGISAHGVWRCTPAGVFAVIAQSVYNAAELGAAGMVLASDGKLYGVTPYGGATNGGCFFSVTTAGVATILYSFPQQGNYAFSEGNIMLASDGIFYGNSTRGGANNSGFFFRFTSEGVFTPLHDCVNAQGASPLNPMAQASDGNLYGVTQSGGANGYGAIFCLTLAGVYTLLYSF